MTAVAILNHAFARAIAPRKQLSVSQWADQHRILSSKQSAEPGQWRTARNPLLREPMDCFSARSSVREVVVMFPIQLGKTEIAVNVAGYSMTERPGPIMVALPAEVSMNKWIVQKLNPMLEETRVVREVLTSTSSRDGANRREFKDFAGGQLYLEHAGSPARRKSTSVKLLIVDELDEFSANLQGCDDPLQLLSGRTSGFESLYKRLDISTPTLKGHSRIEERYTQSDQRRYHVPCPHCGHMQALEWGGLKWIVQEGRVHGVGYVCAACGSLIDESHKPAMLAQGRWEAAYPERSIRGYHANALYYPQGLGPSWDKLVAMWLEVQNDPARLKTFVNDRLAESWEDATTRAMRHNAVADRAQPYRLRSAPEGVLAITAGVDTQDNRLAVQIVGWGRGMRAWVLDYVELPGDPAGDDVWSALTELLNRPIESVRGQSLRVLSTAIDMGGHRTEAVKAYVRARQIARPMAIFGAVANTAPILGKGKMADVDWKGRADKRGVMIYQVGTVTAKHWLYSRLSRDADLAPDERLVNVSDELNAFYFNGLTSETYNPAKNRFEVKRGVRNEPLDTWIYALIAAHHPELRLHRASAADWEGYADRLKVTASSPSVAQPSSTPPAPFIPQTPGVSRRTRGRMT